MNSKLFSIGDVVALKSHPYFEGLTNIIIAGDHNLISPLMIVVEVLKIKNNKYKGSTSIKNIKYRCIWFSSKSFCFNEIWLFEADLKLILRNTPNIDASTLNRGDRVILKTALYESGKKKSSLTLEDNITSAYGSTTINPLLSFLTPVFQVLEVKDYTSKDPLIDKKTNEVQRIPHSLEVKCSFFNSLADKLTEVTLPLEALESIEEVEVSTLQLLNKSISDSGFLAINSTEKTSIVKPKNLTSRSGQYFLRAFDYVSNKVEEIKISQAVKISKIETPFRTKVPKFNIELNPDSATPSFILEEYVNAIEVASKRNGYLRIKYKNRNEQLSIRTLKNYRVIKVPEGATEVIYLAGFCGLRQGERTFKLDRIQNLQELELNFK